MALRLLYKKEPRSILPSVNRSCTLPQRNLKLRLSMLKCASYDCLSTRIPLWKGPGPNKAMVEQYLSKTGAARQWCMQFLCSTRKNIISQSVYTSAIFFSWHTQAYILHYICILSNSSCIRWSVTFAKYPLKLYFSGENCTRKPLMHIQERQCSGQQARMLGEHQTNSIYFVCLGDEHSTISQGQTHQERQCLCQ